jgi:hypothetical protein
VDRLIEVLRLLAADADQQVAALPDFVVVTDELALLYGDEVLVARARDRQALGSTWAAVEALDATLDRMSEIKSLWNNEALVSAPEWARVRSESRAILSDLGKPVDRPDLCWLHHVPGHRDSD